MSAHLCHAEACKVAVPPRLLMCAKHWRIVPHGLKLQVWATYQPGQERLDGTAPVTEEYLAAAQDAVDAVAEKEGLR